MESTDTSTPAAAAVTLSITDGPQTASVTLSITSSHDDVQSLSDNHSSGVDNVMTQNHRHSTSSVSSQSEVGVNSCPVSPDDTNEYSRAAENVSDTPGMYQRCSDVRPRRVDCQTRPANLPVLDSAGDDHCSNNTTGYSVAAEQVADTPGNYQRCGDAKPRTADFATGPADLPDLVSDDDVQWSTDSSLTSLQDDRRSVRSDNSQDEVKSSTDLYCSAARQGSLQNLSDKCSNLTSPHITSAVAVSSHTDAKQAADFGNCSSQFQTLDLTGMKAVCDDYSASYVTERPSSGDYSSMSQNALCSTSSDAGYAHASVVKGGVSSDLYGTAAPLSPVYDPSPSIL